MRMRSAAITLALLALVAGLVAASVSPSSAAAAGKPCWERVIDDWLDNGTIDGQYKPACYQQALKHVPEDLRDYSNITDAISAALSASLRGGGTGTGTGSGNGSGSSSGGNGEAVLGARNRRLARQRHDRPHLQAGLLPGGAQAGAGGSARLHQHRGRDHRRATTVAPRPERAPQQRPGRRLERCEAQ